jgi:hypothetical protein
MKVTEFNTYNGTNCPFEHDWWPGREPETREVGRQAQGRLLCAGGRPPQTAHCVLYGECLAGLFDQPITAERGHTCQCERRARTALSSGMIRLASGDRSLW